MEPSAEHDLGRPGTGCATILPPAASALQRDDGRFYCGAAQQRDQAGFDTVLNSRRVTSSASRRGGSSPAKAISFDMNPGMTTPDPRIMPRQPSRATSAADTTGIH